MKLDDWEYVFFPNLDEYWRGFWMGAGAATATIGLAIILASVRITWPT